MKLQVHLIMTSLVCAVVSWFLFAAILSSINNAAFADTLLGSNVVIMALTAGILSYLGFCRRLINANNEIN